ncbi:MAG: transposase [Deltaproteobacteria bacterium]|nr:transposase [Deltaproteobacteria bacterium]
MNKEMLDLYSDYLISSFSYTTATGLSRLLDGAITHDRVTNFLAESNFTSKDLWKLAKKDIREIESGEGVVVFDDTIQEKKHTDENEIICWHYDHSEGRKVKGVNILNCLYYNRETSVPLAFEVVRKDEKFVDPKDGKAKRRSRISKNEIARDMLDTLRQNRVEYGYVLSDIWFSSCGNMNHVKKKHLKDFVMAVKSNRLVSLSSKDKREGRFSSIKSLRLEAGEIREVYLKGLDFPVSLVKQVFTNKDGSTGVRYLVCSDLSLSSSEIRAIYKKRWKVEEFHKSIKSNAALAKSPTRVETTQKNHFFASVFAFVKLERLKKANKLNHFALKSKLYIVALKTAYAELYRMNARIA